MLKWIHVKGKIKSPSVQKAPFYRTGYIALALLVSSLFAGKLFDLGTNLPCWLNPGSCSSADTLAMTIQLAVVAILSVIACIAFFIPAKLNPSLKLCVVILASALLSFIAWHCYVLAQA